MEIIIPIGADISGVESELNQLKSKVEQGRYLAGLQKEAEKVGKQPVDLQFTGEDRLSPTFNLIAKSADEFERKVEELTNALVKQTNVEKGSVASLRAILAANKQAVSQTRQGTDANLEARDALLSTIEAIRSRTSASRDSIDLLKLEETALKNLIAYQALSTEEREKASLALIRNGQDQLKTLGVEENSVTAKRKLINELQGLADSYDEGSAANIRYLAQVRALKSELEGGGSVVRRFIDTLNKIATVQAGFTAISTIVQAFNGFINQFVSQTKRVQSFSLALGNVGLSTNEVSRAFQQANDTANNLGAPLEQVEKSYKRMVPALQAVGASTEEADRFIESITARTQVLGLSTEESGRLLEAFAQVLSKGKLQSEELNQQISELDGAFRTQLAEAIGVSTQELEGLIAAGDITADRFVKAVGQMENGVTELTGRVAAGNTTVQQLQNIIANIQTRNIRAIAQALEPGIKAFLEIGLAVQNFVDEILKTEFGKFLIDSFNGVLVGIKNFITGFLSAAKAIADFLTPLFVLIRGVNDLLKPFGGVIGVLTTFGAALLTGIAIVQAYHTVLALKKPFLVFVASNALTSKAVTSFQATLNALTFARFKAGFASVVESFSGFGRVLSLAGSAIKGAATGSVTDITRVKNAVEGFTESFKGGKLDFSKAFKFPDFKKAQGDVRNLETGIERYNRVVEKVRIEKLKLSNPEAYAAAMEGVADSTDEVAKASKGASVGAGLLKGALIAGLVVFASWAAATADAAKIQNELSKATADLARKYDDATEAIDKQANAWGNLGVFLNQYGEALQRTYGNKVNKQIEATTKGIAAQEAQYGSIVIALSKYGLKLNDLNSVRSASDASLAEGNSIAKDAVAANEAQIEAIEKQIVAQQSSIAPNQRVIDQLEEQKTKKQEDLKQSKQYLDAINREIDTRIKQGRSLEDLISSYEDLKAITDKKIGLIDIEQANKELSILQQFDSTITGRVDQEAALTASTVTSTVARLEAYRQERDGLDALLEKGEMSYTEYSAKVIENEKNIVDAQRQSVEAQRQFADLILAEFERVINKGSEISGIYQGIAQSILAAYDGVSSAAGTAISSLGTLIDSVVEREIQGLEVGNQRRKEIVEFQLRSQAQLNELEFELAQQKLALATRIANIETQTIQARLEAEAAIAQARGDDDTAAALRAAAAAQNEILAARQTQYNLEVQSLQIQKAIKDEYLNQKAIAEGIKPGKNIGTSITRFSELKQITKNISDNVKGVTTSLSANAINNATNSFEAQSDALVNANSRVKELTTSFKGVYDASDLVRKTVDRIASASGKAAGELRNIANLVNTPARWMGGSVSAGQTYRVNDGGFGREAFINQFGRMTMLPASQNINWTAPSSGTIVPANLVKQMSRNSDINNKVNVAAAKVNPIVSIAASRAVSSDSGNLVKRMDSAMAGSSTNQRITNNITIQSQQPVTDASKLMTEAAMQRLRRSRKY